MAAAFAGVPGVREIQHDLLWIERLATGAAARGTPDWGAPEWEATPQHRSRKAMLQYLTRMYGHGAAVTVNWGGWWGPLNPYRIDGTPGEQGMKDWLAGHDLAGVDWCWLALGSEGRGEQTFATDQDNALLFVAPEPGQVERWRGRLLAFAREVNAALATLGLDAGMRVVSWDMVRAEAPFVQRQFGSRETADFLKDADFVVLTLPATPATQNLVDRDFFKAA